jgi:general secretion pathway protein D
MKKVMLILFFITSIFAGVCDKKLFTIHLKHSIKFQDILSDLSSECNLNIVVKDDEAYKVLNSDINFVNVDNVNLKELLDILFDMKNLFYKLKGNKLYISYFETKTFKLDFVPNSITGTTNVDTDDNSVKTDYSFDFWKNLQDNLKDILSNIDNNSKDPIIDKNAGLITVTANKIQMDKIKNYLDDLSDRLHKEVLIDVRIYSVDLSESHKTGIDWSQFSLGINGNLKYSASRNYSYQKDKTNTNDVGYVRELTKVGSIARGNGALISGALNINGVINFLAQHGNVNSISNPKIVTLNNQKALIRVGNTIYYKYANQVTTDQNGNPTTSYTINSKFVGVVLDITPQISDNGNIILSINPRISSFKDFSQLNDTSRDMPPDTKEDSLISVVRMKDNQTLVLGGLITNDKTLNVNGVPILKEIPLIKYLFSSKEKIINRKELVFVITPHIIDLKTKKTLKDYGFKKLPSLEDLNVR